MYSARRTPTLCARAFVCFLAVRTLGFAQEPSDGQVVYSTGTGIVVTDSGHILTNNHVVEGCDGIGVGTLDGHHTAATVLFADQGNDLALIRLAESVPLEGFASFRISPLVRNGETIAVYGFPLAGDLFSEGNITSGNISALGGPGDDVNIYQFTAPIQPGNSGGPLLDEAGNVVGVVRSKLDWIGSVEAKSVPQNVNFAIKATVAVSFLQAHNVPVQLAEHGTKLSLPDIADAARQFTVLVVCVVGQTPSPEPPPAITPPKDPSSLARLEEFDRLEREHSRHDPPRASKLIAAYEAFLKLTDDDVASAGPLAQRILGFAEALQESAARLEEFSIKASDPTSINAVSAYDALATLDKLLYHEMASEEVFLKVCAVEANLAAQIQTELRLCRDPSVAVTVNGIWGQKAVAAARSFMEDAKYWEWTDEAIDLNVPSIELRDLIRKVRTEGYGPVCRATQQDHFVPKVDVQEICNRRLREK